MHQRASFIRISIYKGLMYITPPEGLLERIMARIKKEERVLLIKKVALFSAAALGSLFALIPAFQYALQEFHQSGFYQYLSLLFSDSGVVLVYWKEFAMSLAESLPVLGILVFLSAVFVFLGSVKLAINNIKNIYGYQKFIPIKNF